MALFVKECFDVDELNAGNDNVKSLWVSISGKDNILVEVCYRLTNQHEETGNHSTSIWQKLAQTTSLVLVVDFNFPDIHRKYKTAERKQTRRFLGCVEDNFLKQQVRDPTDRSILLDLLSINREGLVRDMEIESCFGIWTT